MIWPVLGLFLVSLVLAAAACAVVRRVSLRTGAVDTAPMPGQVKMPTRRVPNTGGVGLFLAIALPLVACVALAHALGDGSDLRGTAFAAAIEHLPGVREQTGLALGLLGCVLGLHVLGLIDDRRPMGPGVKLAVMGLPAVVAATALGTRLLDLDVLRDLAGGVPVVSIAVSVLWFVAVTNAMNFIDNMDGCAGGVGAIAAAGLGGAALLSGQWFVASLAAVLAGACLGFLIHNYPRARLFMGDGGSLVLGFLLAFLAARVTYIPHHQVSFVTPSGVRETALVSSTPWYALLMPVCALGVPLYDFASVTLLRLRQGKSPFRGDLQHLSHRLVKRGLTKPVAAAVIWAFTGVCAALGLLLTRASPGEAGLIALVLVLVFGILAAIEFGTSARAGGDEMLRG
jgi:UDP-GlcNAc:undecaprenyl-phosphate GlcNAc-1-phosphate transferase